MKLLALDTSSLACSVALQYDGRVTERYEEQPREHTRLLLPMIESVLDEMDTVLSGLDAIVLGIGPGSFIGMRIAASVAQGLAFGAGLQIVPVSSLAAVAAQTFAEYDATEVVVAQDAHMNEVYLGIYRQVDGFPVATNPERLQQISSINELQATLRGPRVAAGFGWQRYPALLASNEPQVSTVATVLHPRAKFLLRIGEQGRAFRPQDIAPAYLRQKVAEKSVQGS